MHPIRKQRLFTVLFIVIASSAGIGLVLYSLSDNLNMFYPPSKIIAGEAPEGRAIRAGGCVVPGSVKRDGDTLKVDFSVTDGVGSFPVSYEGILPDLFEEGEATVLTGQMVNGVFEASKVLAKHDETYTPREVSDTLQEAGSGARDYSKDAATCEVLTYDS